VTGARGIIPDPWLNELPLELISPLGLRGKVKGAP
jgi:hypothetical protein